MTFGGPLFGRPLLLVCLLPAVVACSVGGTSSIGPTSSASSADLPSIGGSPQLRTAPPPSQPVNGEVPADIMARAGTDLGGRTGLDPASFTVVRSEQVQWPDTSLGCPMPGMMYAQVVTQGYRLVFEVDGRQYDYRATETGVVRPCEPSNPKPSG